MSIEIRGDKELIEGLNKIQKKLIENPTELLDAGGEIILKTIRQNFMAEGRPERWVSLAPRTQRERRAEGYGAEHPILRRSGELMKSASEKGAFGNWYEINRDTLLIACLLTKGEKLQKGDSTKNLPARPFMVLQNNTPKEILTAMQILIIKKLQEFMPYKISSVSITK